jgi:hypothetical protein
MLLGIRFMDKLQLNQSMGTESRSFAMEHDLMTIVRKGDRTLPQCVVIGLYFPNQSSPTIPS